jgi:hypothetical protein
VTTKLTSLAVAAGLLVGGCGASDLLQPTANQGIEGMVSIGPMCPVQTIDDPCPDAPYEAWIEVSTAMGGFVTRVRSAEDGTFRIGLRPGRYVLDPETDGRLPMAAEQTADVVRGAYTQVQISYDSGIR